MNRGSILEQPLTEQQTIHEFAHILDDLQHHWSYLDTARARIFKVTFEYNSSLREPPQGFIDVYSTANDAENFAQHFTAYTLDSERFRKLAKNDSLLQQKYDFFKNNLFDGREY